MAAVPNVNRSLNSMLRSAPVDAPTSRRILALDYGRKRLGIAVSDEMRLTARPLETLERTNRAELFHKLRKLARDQHASLIVVGYPLNLDGSVSNMATEAAAFAARLQKELGIPVELADERLTSWAANQVTTQNQGITKKNNNKGTRSDPKNDAAAAAIILRDYLENAASKRAPNQDASGIQQPSEAK